MVEYKCDRCGKVIHDHDEKFTLVIEPPRYYIMSAFDPDRKCFETPMHLCKHCVNKVIECIDELGRNE